MENQVPEPSADRAEVLNLGAVLGQIRAFGHVAGRCTAAQAMFIKQTRDQKTYKKICSDWRQFCPEYLHISGAQADRIIALLDEFGPGIFDLKQLMNISPETYRIVEPVVKDHAILHNGETIELDPANAQRVAEAVSALRRQAALKLPVSNDLTSRIARIEKRFFAILDEIDQFVSQGEEAAGLFNLAVQRMSSALSRLITDNRL